MQLQVINIRKGSTTKAVAKFLDFSSFSERFRNEKALEKFRILWSFQCQSVHCQNQLCVDFDSLRFTTIVSIWCNRSKLYFYRVWNKTESISISCYRGANKKTLVTLKSRWTFRSGVLWLWGNRKRKRGVETWENLWKSFESYCDNFSKVFSQKLIVFQ